MTLVKIYKEKAGVLSSKPLWVGVHDGYMYTATTKKKLAFLLATEWKNQKHLIG